VDVDDGKEGEKSLAHLEETYEPLPTRRKARTGGGGIQYYFRYSQGYGRIGNLTDLLPGIDVRGEGGYIILPPSVSHKGPYTWEEKGKRGYAPEWLIDLILTPPSKNGRDRRMDSFMGEDGTVVIPHGARDNTLFRLASSFRGKGLPLSAATIAVEKTDEECSEYPGGKDRSDRSAEAIVRSAYQRYEAGKLWISSKGTDE
jgi:putative DNA primase/helicase